MHSLAIISGIRRPAAVLSAALLLVSVAGGPTRAGYTLDFGQPVYLTSTNQNVSVSVFLTENDALNILKNQGLNGAGFVLSYNVPTRATSPAQVISFTPNPGNDPVNDFASFTNVAATPSTTGTATAKFSQFFSNPLSSNGTNQILLGTFLFKSGTVSPDLTRLTLAVATPGNQFVTGTGTVLDPNVTAGTPSAIQIGGAAVVPEPQAIVLCLTGLPVLLGWRALARKSPRV